MDTRRPGRSLLSLVSLLLLTLMACQGELSSGTMESSKVGSGETSLAPALYTGSATPPLSEIGSTGELMGSWVLVAGSVDGHAIPISPELALHADEGEFHFPLACNSASVPYEVNGASIEFDAERFAQTEEGCTSLQADLFEMALLRTRSLSVDISASSLSLVGRGVSLQFDRQSP